MKRGLILLTLWLAAGAGVRAQEARPLLPGAAGPAFPQPASWVPVSAVVEQAGVPVGRFWRAADGSTRVEWTAPTAAGVTIEIRNIAQRRFYTYGPVRGWTAQPMLLPTQGWTPPPVSVRAAGVRVGTTAEGYEIYERRKPDGTVERRLPALNFLAAPVATAGVATALVAIEVGRRRAGCSCRRRRRRCGR